MAAPDDAYLKNIINSNLVDSPPGQPRRNTATTLRAVLFALIDWVKNISFSWLRLEDGTPTGNQADTIYHTGKVLIGRSTDDGSGFALQASSASFPFVNGMPGGQLAAITSVLESNIPFIRYLAFAELPAETGGTFDFIHFTLVAKPWENSNGQHLVLQLYAANRGTFKAFHQTLGEQDQVGIVAVRQADGRTILAVRTDNAFRSISIKIHQHAQAVLYPAFTLLTTMPGTLVYDTLNLQLFKPLMALRPRFTTFTAGNADGAYPLTISEAGTGQLSFGANWIPGQTDFSFINSNLLSKGFSFWQQTSSGTKDLLAYLNQGGYLALGPILPTARLHVKDATPYNQFRLENSYTPPNSADPNGLPGSITWDTNFIYVKTGSGWKRAVLQSF